MFANIVNCAICVLTAEIMQNQYFQCQIVTTILLPESGRTLTSINRMTINQLTVDTISLKENMHKKK
jgi:hypothetical protein